MVGEVAFANCEESRNGSLQFVVYPHTTHSVVDGRINHHRLVVFHSVDFVSEVTRINVGDFFVHVEEVAVTLLHGVEAQAVDTLGEVEEHSQSGVVHTESLVATLFGGTACHVTRHEVTECRIATFEVVVAVFFRYFPSLFLAFLQSLCVFQFLRNPDTSVITERFRHKSQFRLLVAVNRNTGRVDLHICRVCHISTLAVALNSRCAVASHGVGREEISVSVTTCCDNHRICGEAFQFTCNEVLGDDTAGTTVHDHHVFHLITCKEFHLSGLHLCAEGRICAEQELLACLAFRIECAAHLGATERTVGEHTAVFACERHTLCHTLVYDVVAHFCQAIYVGFTCTVVAALHCVIEQTINGVAVVLVVFGCVDTALCCD